MLAIITTISLSIFTLFCSSYRSPKNRAASIDDGQEVVNPLLNQADKNISQSDELNPADKLSTKDFFQTKVPALLSRYQSYELEPLPLKSQDISVVITGHKAKVIFDLVYYNPGNRMVSGKFLVSLPNGASPAYLGMFQGQGPASKGLLAEKNWLQKKSARLQSILGKDIKLENEWQNKSASFDWGEKRAARVINPIKGRQIYENTVRRRVDPALAEWAGASKFSTRIYPIAAKGYKRIVFAYTQAIESHQNDIQYILPLPNKSKAQTRLTLHLIKNYYRSPHLSTQNSLKKTRTKYGWKWVMEGDSQKPSTFQATPINKKVQYIVGENPNVRGKLVHLQVKPIQNSSSVNRKTKKALFLVDTSYSARSKLHNLSGRILAQVLKSDTSITQFAIVLFDVKSQILTKFVANTSSNRKKWLEKVSSIQLEGATNFSSALDLIQQKQSLKADTYFLLSDGHITWGDEKAKSLQAKYSNLMGKRWICYSYGSHSINQSLFQTLTKVDGRIVPISSGQNISSAAKAHRVSGIRLKRIYVKDSEVTIAGNPKWIYPGQLLELAIKTYSQRRTIYLQIDTEKSKQKVAIDLQVSKFSKAIAARSWASVYVNRLLEFYDKQADELVLALSQNFSLSNRAASFIILETDNEYKQHKIVNQQLNLAKIAQKVRSKKGNIYATEGSREVLAKRQKLFEALASCKDRPVWKVRKNTTSNYSVFK
ncbi:MAG: hypothetical protein AAF518_25970, partial [Spirochaetota bacterium]